MTDEEFHAAPESASEVPAMHEAKEDSPIIEAVESWFVEQIHNSPVSRDTATFNHVRQAVDELKKRLGAI